MRGECVEGRYYKRGVRVVRGRKGIVKMLSTFIVDIHVV